MIFSQILDDIKSKSSYGLSKIASNLSAKINFEYLSLNLKKFSILKKFFTSSKTSSKKSANSYILSFCIISKKAFKSAAFKDEVMLLIFSSEFKLFSMQVR